MSWKDELREYIVGAQKNQLTEDSPQADQPTWIRTALRPHQLSLLSAARALEQRASLRGSIQEEPQLLTRYGVLADRVGAGKSLVALSLARDPPVDQAHFTLKEGGTARIVGLQHLPAVQPWLAEWSDLSGDDLLNRLLPSRTAKFYTRTALFIVPHNVLPQWETYIREQTTLDVAFIKRTKDCDYDRVGFLRDMFTRDAVIVSCTMLRKFVGALSFFSNDAQVFGRIVWSRVFIDEADSIACTLRPGEISYRFLWLITGSWLNVLLPSGLYSWSMQNLPPDLRAVIGDGQVRGVRTRQNVVGASISDSRDPRFTATVLRNADSWIDTSLLKPVILHEEILCKAPANLSVLREFISPAAMEALHAGDVAGAMATLGLRSATKETLADRVTESLRGDLLQAEKILAFKRDMEYSTAQVKTHAIEKAEAKVARIKQQLASLEARLAALSGESLCPICYDTPRTTTLTPCCRHAFCLSCLCECIAGKPNCPMCRREIRSVRDLLVVGEESSAATETGPSLPAKGAALLKLLSESTAEQRFLIFSAHEASFKGLREFLAARDIRCEMLSGTAVRIERLRRQFREGDVRVLCMNARHVGAGINLESATHVVLYHRMNLELEKQVIGRAVRFERSAELRVVHLVHEHETAYNGASSSEVIVHV